MKRGFMGRIIDRIVHVIFGVPEIKTVIAAKPTRRRIISHGIGSPGAAKGQARTSFDQRPNEYESAGVFYNPVITTEEPEYREPVRLGDLMNMAKDFEKSPDLERKYNHGIDSDAGSLKSGRRKA